VLKKQSVLGGYKFILYSLYREWNERHSYETVSLNTNIYFMSRFGVSASSMDLSHQEENKRRTLGLKLKNSYSKSTHENTLMHALLGRAL
jgi:hypothetical protein